MAVPDGIGSSPASTTVIATSALIALLEVKETMTLVVPTATPVTTPVSETVAVFVSSEV